jgi:hypothetical protein
MKVKVSSSPGGLWVHNGFRHRRTRPLARAFRRLKRHSLLHNISDADCAVTVILMRVNEMPGSKDFNQLASHADDLEKDRG